MSGFPNIPATSDSTIYNPSFYSSQGDNLTLGDAELTFAKLFDPRFTLLSDITAGVASASKALITDSSNNITGIGSLSCTSLTVNGESISGGISQAAADARYFQLTGGSLNGNINLGPLNDYFINGQTYSSILRIANDARYVGIDLNGGEGIMNGARSIVNLTGASESSFLTFRNPASSTNCVIGLSNTDCFIGTRTATSLSLLSNNISRVLINTSGNVGIGKSPSYKLDIAGDVNISGTFRVNGSALSTDGFLGGSIDANITAIRTNISLQSLYNAYPLTCRYNNSIDNTLTGIAFACITPDNTTPGAAIIHRRIGGNSQGNLEFCTKSTGGATDALTEWLRLTYNGRFGTNTAERFYGSRGRIDANQYSIFGTALVGGDGTFTDRIVYNNSSNVVSINAGLTASNITGNEITGTFGNFRTTAGGSVTVLELGNNNATTARYRFTSNYNSSAPQNSSMNFSNSSSGWGISYANFGYGNSREGAAMVLNPGPNGDGTYITAGLSTQLGSLHINGGVSTYVSENREFSRTSIGNFQAGGTVLVSLYAQQNIWIRGSVYSSSDARMKKNIEAWDTSEAMNLLKDGVKPVLYEWKDSGMGGKQFGYLAQDLHKAGCKSLIQVFSNDSVKEKCEETGMEVGTQMVVDYSKLNIHLVEICKVQQRKLEELEKTIENLCLYGPIRKHLNKLRDD